jgi:hypothetical protein
VFLTLLRRFNSQGRRVIDNSSSRSSYAPKVFAEEPEAKGIPQPEKAFADAMKRLFTAKRIRVGQETAGAPSKRKARLEETTGDSENKAGEGGKQ